MPFMTTWVCGFLFTIMAFIRLTVGRTLRFDAAKMRWPRDGWDQVCLPHYRPKNTHQCLWHRVTAHIAYWWDIEKSLGHMLSLLVELLYCKPKGILKPLHMSCVSSVIDLSKFRNLSVVKICVYHGKNFVLAQTSTSTSNSEMSIYIDTKFWYCLYHLVKTIHPALGCSNFDIKYQWLSARLW